jgi:hypothetical protein
VRAREKGACGNACCSSVLDKMLTRPVVGASVVVLALVLTTFSATLGAVARKPSWGTVVIALAVVLLTQAMIEGAVMSHVAGVDYLSAVDVRAALLERVSLSPITAVVVKVSCIVSVVALLAMSVARNAWQRATNTIVESLRDRAISPHESADDRDRVYNPAMIKGLPDPVVRYFKATLTPGQAMVRTATLTQSGGFRAVRIIDHLASNRPNQADSKSSWQPFEATEFFTASPHGFVWDARITMAPMLVACVRDGYSNGAGSMHVKLNSIFTVVDAASSPQLNSGEPFLC